MRGRKNGARTGVKVPLCEERACRWKFDKVTTAAQTASISARQHRWNLRFLGFSFYCCPLQVNQRFFSKLRRNPRPSRRSAVNSNFASTRNVSQRSSRHHGGADRVVLRASAVARGLRPPFRLFPWHVGALNACRAFNFAAAPWKFARKLAARPTASAEHGQKKRRLCAS